MTKTLLDGRNLFCTKKNYASKKTDPDSQHFFHNKEDKDSFKKTDPDSQHFVKGENSENLTKTENILTH